MKTETVEKIVANLHHKKYVVHKRNIKQTLNHGLVLKKVYRVVELNQKGWLKPYIDMTTELGKKAKMTPKNFFSR